MTQLGLSDRRPNHFRGILRAKPLLETEFRPGVFRQFLEEFRCRSELLKNPAGFLGIRDFRFSGHRGPFRTDLTAFEAKQTRNKPLLQLTA